MMRKFLSFIFSIFLIFTPFLAHSAEMVNVEYIHNALNSRWGVDLPYSPELSNPGVVANMKYLLTVVDLANEYLNDGQATDYGNSEYATMAVADTTATNTAIETLIHAPGFYITTTSDTTTFSFEITTSGDFQIDWGDGDREIISDKPNDRQTYSHTYDAAGSHKIRLSGKATGYSSNKYLVPLVFSDKKSIAGISGSLGRIFSTLPDGTNPTFFAMFEGASNLTGEIPPNLFDGITGKTGVYMFSKVFASCPKLSGSIPEDLFAGITGPIDIGTFDQTFAYCTGLTGSIPEKLFSRINSGTEEYIFNQTFSGCTGLTGSIPENLFQGIKGAPQVAFFCGTFKNCSNLSGKIPENLFAGVQGAPAESCFADTFHGGKYTGTIPENLFKGVVGAPAVQMFSYTFAGNRQLQSPIPAGLFAGIKGPPARNMFAHTFFQCSSIGAGLPETLFSGIQGAPEYEMFLRTFSDSGITNIPENLFSGIKGAPAYGMFNTTFSWNYNLTSIPAGLFSGISGEPAPHMYDNTFSDTTVKSIPVGLFGNIGTTPATGMFKGTFRGCKWLTGESAKTADGVYLYDLYPDFTEDMGTYSDATGLTDYEQIPDNWK